MIAYQYLNAVFCIALGVLSYYEDTSGVPAVMTVLALLGKGLAVSAFGGMFILGTELFPTEIRSSAFGVSSFAARVGSLVAPQIILLVSTYFFYTRNCL